MAGVKFISGDANENLSAVLETLRVFWPGARLQFEQEAVGADQAFVALPSANRPRILVPLAPYRAAASALLRFSPALSLRETATRTAVAGFIGVVGPSYAGGDVLTVRDAGDSLLDHLAECFNQPVNFAVTIGQSRVNRKPVLQVFDQSGRSLAFAKIGVDQESRRLVENEAVALSELADGLSGFQFPTFIGLTEWRGLRVLLMSALKTRPQALSRSTPIPIGPMASFSQQFGARTAPLIEVAQWRRVHRVGLPQAGSLLESIAEVERIAASMPDVHVGAWHGDWTVWNMARLGGRLQLWDFERFERDGVQGLDAFHFAVNSATHRGAIGLGTIHAGLERAVSALGPGPESRLLGAVYLAVISERYLQYAGSSLGRLVQDRAEHMVASLREWLPTVGRNERRGR